MAHEDFMEKFKKTFLSQDSDINGFMELLDPNCEWIIEASGETFRGYGNFKEFAERSKAARTHTSEVQMVPTTFFATESYFVIEYMHNAITTEKWTTSTSQPPKGLTLHIPICIIAHFKGERLDWIHEYFDLLTARGAGQKLYS
jgi:ketosteroid isomerase-like protein